MAELLKGTHAVPSLVRGGPSWQVEQWLGFLAEDGLPTKKAAIVIALFCWLPLACLSGFDHRNWDLQFDHGFYTDIGCYARFLVAVYILIITDRYTDNRLNRLLAGFEDTGIISREVHEDFFALVVRADQRTSSAVAEGVLLAVAFIAGIASIYLVTPGDRGSWMLAMPGFPGPLSPAGWWEILVAFPLYYFLMLRWIWRLVVWAALMREIAKLPLQLIPTHPDRAGGLGFLTVFPSMFLPLIFSLSIVFASGVLQLILIEAKEVIDLEIAVAVWTALVLAVFVGPLGFFSPNLMLLKEQAIIDYGSLVAYCSRMAEKHMFDDLANGRPIDKDTVSLVSDISAGLENIKSMKPVPVELFALVPIVVSALLPLAAAAAVKYPVASLLWTLFTSVI